MSTMAMPLEPVSKYHRSLIESLTSMESVRPMKAALWLHDKYQTLLLDCLLSESPETETETTELTEGMLVNTSDLQECFIITNNSDPDCPYNWMLSPAGAELLIRLYQCHAFADCGQKVVGHIPRELARFAGHPGTLCVPASTDF